MSSASKTDGIGHYALLVTFDSESGSRQSLEKQVQKQTTITTRQHPYADKSEYCQTKSLHSLHSRPLHLPISCKTLRFGLFNFTLGCIAITASNNPVFDILNRFHVELDLVVSQIRYRILHIYKRQHLSSVLLCKYHFI